MITEKQTNVDCYNVEWKFKEKQVVKRSREAGTLSLEKKKEQNLQDNENKFSNDVDICINFQIAVRF